jgi:hypothetical protein
LEEGEQQNKKEGLYVKHQKEYQKPSRHPLISKAHLHVEHLHLKLLAKKTKQKK